jgi:uncharacterized membrane protein YozB (DUF420 family)
MRLFNRIVAFLAVLAFIALLASLMVKPARRRDIHAEAMAAARRAA